MIRKMYEGLNDFVSADTIKNTGTQHTRTDLDKFVLAPGAVQSISSTLDPDDKILTLKFMVRSDAEINKNNGKPIKSRTSAGAYRKQQDNLVGMYKLQITLRNEVSGIILNRLLRKLDIRNADRFANDVELADYTVKKVITWDVVRDCVIDLWNDKNTKWYADCGCPDFTNSDNNGYCKHIRHIVGLNEIDNEELLNKIAEAIMNKVKTLKIGNFVQRSLSADTTDSTVKKVRNAITIDAPVKRNVTHIRQRSNDLQDELRKLGMTVICPDNDRTDNVRNDIRNTRTLGNYNKVGFTAYFDNELVFALNILSDEDNIDKSSVVVSLSRKCDENKILAGVDMMPVNYSYNGKIDSSLKNYDCGTDAFKIIKQITKNVKAMSDLFESYKKRDNIMKKYNKSLKEGLEFDTTPEQIYEDCGVLISAMDADDALALHTNQVADIIERYDSGVEIDDVDGALVQMLMCKLNTVNTVDDVVSTSKEPEDTDYRNGKYADVIVDVDEYPVEYDDVDKEFDSEYDEVCRNCRTSQKRKDYSGRNCGSRPKYACTGMNSRRAECGGEQRSVQYRGERRGGYMR